LTLRFAERQTLAVDKAEAREIARARLSELRRLPWEQLRRYIDDSETMEITGPSGTSYQVQTRAVWDGQPEEVLRVWALVDDGGWRAFAPLSEEFLIAPDGSFVHE